MISKSIFENELNQYNLNPQQFSLFVNIYNSYIDLCSGKCIPPENIDTVSNALSILFKGKYTDFSIPYNFIDSAVGCVLFSVKFGAQEAIFTPIEVATITNKTKSLISHDIKNLKLCASMYNKSYTITKSSLISYMCNKGYSREHSLELINTFSKLKSNGYSLKDISLELNKK